MSSSNGKNGADNGATYLEFESPEAIREFAARSVNAMLGLSIEEAFERQAEGQYVGTIVEIELNSLRELLAQAPA